MLALALLTLTPTAPQAGLPLLFEENNGRYAAAARFVARPSGQTVFLRDDGLDLVLRGPEGPHAVQIRFEGGRALGARGAQALPTRVNHLFGSDPSAWSTNNPTFARVELDQVWPGIDAVFYERHGTVEHDFVVAPGVDPDAIRLRFEGVERLAIDGGGRLVLQTLAGDATLSAPVLYQGDDDVAGRYRLLGDDLVGFEVGAYDATRPLVIDPVLIYATYLGGDDEDWLFDVVTDTAGATFVCGQTKSADLPVTAGALIGAHAKGYDGYVAKLAPAGDALEWCTYLGGSDSSFSNLSDDVAHAIGLDSAGNVVVAGFSESKDFPITPGALKTTPTWVDGFVTKLTPSGDALVWSTFLGGVFHDRVYGLALDANDAVYLTGQAGSDNFPATAGAAQTTYGGAGDAFTTKLSAGGGLVWSTFLGGDKEDLGRDVEVDAAGRVYTTGHVNSTGLSVNGFQTGLLGTADAYVARHSADGSTLEYLTYVGSDASAPEAGFWQKTPGIAVAPEGGRVWFAGTVHAPFASISPGAFDTTFAGNSEGLAALIDTDLVGAASLVHATYVGGNASDHLADAELDADGDVWLVGATESADFPVLDAWQLCPLSTDDIVLLELGSTGALLASTFFGGTNQDSNLMWSRLDIGVSGDLTLVCRTASLDLATAGAFDETQGGAIDGYVARFSPAAPPTASATLRTPCVGLAPSGSLVASGAPVIGSTFTVSIDDPLAQTGLAPGSLTLVGVSTGPAPGFPCGIPVPGLGVAGGPGEILIDVAPPNPIVVTNPEAWNGPGTPAVHHLPIPCATSLHGVSLSLQGMLLGGGAIVLTDALDLVLGS